MTSPHRSRSKSLTGLVGFLLLVSACTNGGDEEAAPTTEAAPATTEAVEAPTTTEAPEASTTLPPVEPEGDALDTDRVLESSDGQALPEELGPLGETERVIETNEGEISIGTGEVPEEVEEALPLPDDFEVQLASDTATDLGFSGTTASSLEELTEMYDLAFADESYTLEDRQEIPGTIVVYEISSASASGQVAVSATPGAEGSTILVTWNPA